MLLLREVYGWLKYCINKDPILIANKITAEEIGSSALLYNDRTDGVRTLAIYQADKGLTPRLELRFTALHPQVWWVPSNTIKEEYVQITNPFGAPGAGESFDVSDCVEFLVGMTKEKFGLLPKAKIVVIQAGTEVDAAVIPFDQVLRILRAVKKAATKGKKTLEGKHPQRAIEDFLKKDMLGNITDFFKSIMKYWQEGKLGWSTKNPGSENKEIPGVDYLEDEINPGLDAIPMSLIKKHIGDNPSSFTDNDREAVGLQPVNVAAALDKIISNTSAGKESKVVLPLALGVDTQECLLANTLPLNYLEAVAACDPQETLAPWSFIARSVIAYGLDKGDPELLSASIMEWLEGSDLLMPLYQAHEPERETLRKVVQSHVESHIKDTINNKVWLKSVVAGLSHLDDELDQRRALQAEFDMWLLDALSPSVSPNKIPLSAYAFSSEKRDQELYTQMISNWAQALRGFAKTYRQESLAALTSSLKNFFVETIKEWGKDSLRNYKPKVPSITKIIAAVKANDKVGLFNVLVEDFEGEVGSEIPDEVRANLMSSPYFNNIVLEVKVQGAKF